MPILQWNLENKIFLFRLSSEMFPWCSEYTLEDLPDYEEICVVLREVGDYATAHNMRLTFHPSHFIQLASLKESVVEKSLHELEIHNKIFDLMGFEASPVNKINIHIGLAQDKERCIERWIQNFHKLSVNCKRRMTLENDDKANAYSVRDLLKVNEEIGIPIVFDMHHHRFHDDGMTEQEALEACIATWEMSGVRPVIHWSESQPNGSRKPNAHSDLIENGFNLYGHHDEVDVQLEAKFKEQAVLHLRERYAKAHKRALKKSASSSSNEESITSSLALLKI